MKTTEMRMEMKKMNNNLGEKSDVCWKEHYMCDNGRYICERAVYVETRSEFMTPNRISPPIHTPIPTDPT